MDSVDLRVGLGFALYWPPTILRPKDKTNYETGSRKRTKKTQGENVDAEYPYGPTC